MLSIKRLISSERGETVPWSDVVKIGSGEITVRDQRRS